MASFRQIPREVKTSVFSKVQLDLHSASDLAQLCRNIDQMLKDEFGAATTLISIFDSYRDQLTYVFPERLQKNGGTLLKLGEGVAGKVAGTQVAVLVEDLQDFPESRRVYAAAGISSACRVMAAPLIRRGALLGVLEIVRDPDTPSADADALPYLDALAHQMAIGVNYFKLFEQAARSSLEEEKLAMVSQQISVSLDMDELLDVIIDALRSLVPYHAAGIFLLDNNDAAIRRMVVYGYPEENGHAGVMELGESANSIVRRSGRAVILRDLPRQPGYARCRPQARSAMLAPILSNHRRIGLFVLESDVIDAYTAEDLALFQKFSLQAALSIEKAQLYQALLDKNRLERELAIARDIQKSFLPLEAPQLPGFEMAGLNLPSRLVSGDYYDFIRIIEGQWGVIIGDVSGKGIPASLIMACFRASLLAEIRNNYAISDILGKVNKLLWESTASNQFVTAFYGVIDVNNHVLTYCNAGHNPGVIVRADGRRETLERGGLILGAFPDASYEESFVGLKPGDILLLYTDGVTEIHNEEGMEFGVRRLVRLVRENNGLSARQISELLQANVLEFAAGSAIQDDFTLVVVKCAGLPS